MKIPLIPTKQMLETINVRSSEQFGVEKFNMLFNVNIRDYWASAYEHVHFEKFLRVVPLNQAQIINIIHLN